MHQKLKLRKASTKVETPVQNKVDEYFQQNEKFFNTGDINAKKAFFMLGQYCRKVGFECEEKKIAEKRHREQVSSKIGT